MNLDSLYLKIGPIVGDRLRKSIAIASSKLGMTKDVICLSQVRGSRIPDPVTVAADCGTSRVDEANTRSDLVIERFSVEEIYLDFSLRFLAIEG